MNKGGYNMRYRVAILTDKGTLGENFKTKEQAENWLLDCMNKEDIKQYRIWDKIENKIVDKG